MNPFNLLVFAVLHPLSLLLTTIFAGDLSLSRRERCTPLGLSLVLWALQFSFWILSMKGADASFATAVYLLTVWGAHWTEVSDLCWFASSL